MTLLEALPILPFVFIGTVMTLAPFVVLVMFTFNIRIPKAGVPNLRLVFYTFIGVILAWSPILYLGK